MNKTSPLQGNPTNHGMLMPGDEIGVPPPPPPRFGRQMAQLVLIPAAIMMACIGVAVIFGILAGRPDSLQDQLLRLRQSSGAGKIALGLQDPRYKDRSLAAANIAKILPGIKDPKTRAQLDSDLRDILQNSIGPEEWELQYFVLQALGQLGQDDGLATILRYDHSSFYQVRFAVASAVNAWATRTIQDQGPAGRQRCAVALPVLRSLLEDQFPLVAYEAARVLGRLAVHGDTRTIQALHQALARPETEFRDASWNAAIALARLGDAEGGRVVADVLLNRQALAKMSGIADSGSTSSAISPHLQDWIMLSVLDAIKGATDSQIWSRVQDLAQNDTSLAVRKAALDLVQHRSDAENFR